MLLLCQVKTHGTAILGAKFKLPLNNYSLRNKLDYKILISLSFYPIGACLDKNGTYIISYSELVIQEYKLKNNSVFFLSGVITKHNLIPK